MQPVLLDREEAAAALPHEFPSRQMGTGAMKILGVISVELDAVDFQDAARHQKRLEGFLETLRSQYPEAKLSLNPRRERSDLGLGPAPERPE